MCVLAHYLCCKICHLWRFMAARTVLSLLLIACDTKLNQKEMNIKVNTISKKKKKK